MKLITKQTYDSNLIHLFGKHLYTVSYVLDPVVGIENMHRYKHMDKYFCLIHFSYSQNPSCNGD
jgi:hypothetical protein